MKKKQVRICSIPYYREDQIQRFREISTDKENFLISYSQMQLKNESAYRDMEKKGFKVVKIFVDIDELIEWANAHNLPINPESRTRFALESAKKMISNGSISI